MKLIEFYLKSNQLAKHLKEEALANHHSDSALGFKEVHDCYILPARNWKDVVLEGGIVDSENKYIQNSACYEEGSCGYTFDEDTTDIGDVCIFLGFFLFVYGHAITDSFRKIWFLNTDYGHRLIEKGVDLVYISSPNTDMPAWHLRLLELGGANIKGLKHIRKVTRYNRVIIPDNCLYLENDSLYYTDEFQNILSRVKKNICVTPNSPVYTNLYFTRTSLNLGDRECGESALEDIFREHGYQIISPEKFTVDEQIWMLIHCRKFASTECSSSHQAIFCNKDAEVAILKKSGYVNKYSSMIADLVGCKTVYVDSHHTIKIHRKGHVWGPFYLCVTPQLRKYLKEKGIYRPYWLQKSYWEYIIYIISLVIKRIVFHMGIHK